MIADSWRCVDRHILDRPGWADRPRSPLSKTIGQKLPVSIPPHFSRWQPNDGPAVLGWKGDSLLLDKLDDKRTCKDFTNRSIKATFKADHAGSVKPLRPEYRDLRSI